MQPQTLASHVQHILERQDMVEIDKKLFATCGIPVNEKSFADWLTENKLRMINGRKYIALTKQVH